MHKALKTLFTEQRTQFVFSELRSALQPMNIKHITSIKYDPTKNSISERLYQELKFTLQRYSHLRIHKAVRLTEIKHCYNYR